jgi:RNA polymerase sigma-70 factor, ECF subfamily
VLRSDDRDVSGERSRPGAGLLEVYDRALPQVYGYLVSRCGQRSVAEDLTSETFLAAARQSSDGPVSVGWLIGVARHKLADHWRRQAREERLVRAVGSSSADVGEDPFEAHLDVVRAHQLLDGLAPQHRAALTLRYLDGLPVAEVASVLGRTVDATEALLVRARRELRRAYAEGGAGD